MSYSFRAILAYGIDLGENEPFFTDGVDGGVYSWAEEAPQATIMIPITHTKLRATFLAVAGHVIEAAPDGQPVSVDLLQIAAVDQTKVERFKAHLLAAGLDDFEPGWHLIAQVA